MRPRGTQSSLEQRRRRGLILLQKGLSLAEVALRIGCHSSSVLRWRDAYDQHGPTGLKSTPIGGRPPKLAPRDRVRLVQLLDQGPRALGYKSDQWTTATIAELIGCRFGVHYHRDHIGRLMAFLNWIHVPAGTEGSSDADCKAGSHSAIDQTTHRRGWFHGVRNEGLGGKTMKNLKS